MNPLTHSRHINQRVPQRKIQLYTLRVHKSFVINNAIKMYY